MKAKFIKSGRESILNFILKLLKLSFRKKRNLHNIFNKVYVSLFIQDVTAKLLPYNKNNISGSITPVAAKLKVIQVLDGSGDRDVVEGLRRFMGGGLIADLLIHGKAYCEIMLDRNNEIIFKSISTTSILSFLGIKFKYISKEVTNDLRILRLSNKNFFHICLPVSLKRDINNLLSNLVYLSDHQFMPRFVRDEIENKNYKSRYDYNWFKNKWIEIFGRANKYIGWNARNSFKNVTLEYYQLLMLLRFEGFMCQLRTSIINAINVGLAKAFSADDEVPRIELIGVPAVDDINKSYCSLIKGNEKFTDILSRYI